MALPLTLAVLDDDEPQGIDPMTTELATREAPNLSVVGADPTGLASQLALVTLQVRQIAEFYRDVMIRDIDYGVIPGTKKPTLYQSGAQLLDQIFQIVPTFEALPSSVIDWERPVPFFHYLYRCRLISRRNGEVVGEAVGSCNSHEDRYRWRNAAKACPSCGAEALARSKLEWGGGYYCNQKQGGCGARFRGGSPEAAALDQQEGGRIENPDMASLENTISKMAQKRAHVAATLNATGASRIFSQDAEDLPPSMLVSATSEPVTVPAGQRANEPHFDPFPEDQYEPEQQPERPAPPARPQARPAPQQTAWTERRAASWAAGVTKARELGVVIPDRPPHDATSEQILAGLKQMADGCDRAEAVAQLADVVQAAQGAGLNYTVPADLGDLTTAAIRELAEAVQQALPTTPATEADDAETPF